MFSQGFELWDLSPLPVYWDYRCAIDPVLSSVWLGSMEILVRWQADSLPLLLLYSGFQLCHQGFPATGGQCAVYSEILSHAL